MELILFLLYPRAFQTMAYIAQPPWQSCLLGSLGATPLVGCTCNSWPVSLPKVLFPSLFPFCCGRGTLLQALMAGSKNTESFSNQKILFH